MISFLALCLQKFLQTFKVIYASDECKKEKKNHLFFNYLVPFETDGANLQQLSDQLFHKSIINTCLVDFLSFSSAQTRRTEPYVFTDTIWEHFGFHSDY